MRWEWTNKNWLKILKFLLCINSFTILKITHIYKRMEVLITLNTIYKMLHSLYCFLLLGSVQHEGFGVSSMDSELLFLGWTHAGVRPARSISLSEGQGSSSDMGHTRESVLLPLLPHSGLLHLQRRGTTDTLTVSLAQNAYRAAPRGWQGGMAVSPGRLPGTQVLAWRGGTPWKWLDSTQAVSRTQGSGSLKGQHHIREKMQTNRNESVWRTVWRGKERQSRAGALKSYVHQDERKLDNLRT